MVKNLSGWRLNGLESGDGSTPTHFLKDQLKKCYIPYGGCNAFLLVSEVEEMFLYGRRKRRRSGFGIIIAKTRKACVIAII